MSRAIASFAVLCALAAALPGQEPPDPVTAPDDALTASDSAIASEDSPATTADLLDAIAGTAAIFSRAAPGLMAHEILHQRGRRGFISILRQSEGRNKVVAIKLPQDFRTHDVVSDYALGQIGDAFAIHEIRSVLTIDGRTISPADEARHALAIGLQSPDDELKHRLLENFERNRLEGAVADFGQLILLFAAATQSNYTFTPAAGGQVLNSEPMVVLAYQQVAGDTGLTVFHERTVKVRAARGEIWLRRADLLPLRITLFTEEPVAQNLIVRDQAVVDYTPTEFGLAPLHIHHTQLLNSDILVENDLQYSDYQRLTPGMLP